jgi:hypothetical protein
MMKPPPLTISSDRLLLRAARAEDAATMFQEYTRDIQASRFCQGGRILAVYNRGRHQRVG